MSQENVEIVRRACEAATRKSKPDFGTMNVLFHPDHEYVSRLEALEGGVRRGARGYRIGCWTLRTPSTGRRGWKR
jgi:hypothetical protein